MEMKQSLQPQPVLVTGQEAIIVDAYERIEKRQLSPLTGSNMVLPMVLAESSTEAEVIKQYRKIEEKFAVKMGGPVFLLTSTSNTPKQGYYKGSLDEMQLFHAYCPKKRQFSDLELAQLLLQRVNLRRCGELCYLYNSKYYKRLSGNALETLILGQLRRELESSGSSSQIKRIVAAIMAEPTIEVQMPTEAAQYLCVENGVLDIKSGALLPHNPALFLTSQIYAHWDPGASCPCFLRFLDTIAGSDETLAVRFLQALGYLLVPDNRAKRIFLLLGPSDAGKTVFAQLLEAFYDDSVISHIDIFQLKGRFSGSALLGKSLNICNELPNHVLDEENVAVLKALSGGDTMNIEMKYKEPFSSRIGVRVVAISNHALVLNSRDAALYSRLMLLPFRYTIPKSQQDKSLLERLKAEKDGILVLAMRFYWRLVQNNYVFSGDDEYSYEPEERIEGCEPARAIAEYATLFLCPDPVGKVPTEELYLRYTEFCENRGYKTVNKELFSARLFSILKQGIPNLGRSKMRVNGSPKWHFTGVSLNMKGEI